MSSNALTPALHERIKQALSGQDKHNLQALIDLLSASEDTSTYDAELKRDDEVYRAREGLSVREKAALGYFRDLSDDTRRLFLEALGTTDEQPHKRVFSQSEMLQATNQDALASVERLALFIVGSLAARGWFTHIMLDGDGLQSLYGDITRVLYEGLPLVDIREITEAAKSVDD